MTNKPFSLLYITYMEHIMLLSDDYILPEHPLYAKHCDFIKNIFLELPFCVCLDNAITRSLCLSNMSDDEYLILYPNGTINIISAMVHHIIIRTEQYCLTLDMTGVKKKLHHLIMFQMNLYPQMNIVFKKIFPYSILKCNILSDGQHIFKIVDSLWYCANDTATDYNYYTKRVLLSHIYIKTLFFMTQDFSKNFESTDAYLVRQFDNIGMIERIKSKLPNIPNFQDIKTKISAPFARFKNI